MSPLLCAALALAAAPLQGPPLLVEVGASRGIGPYVSPPGLAAGLAAADFDGDGDVDLFVPNGPGAPDQLYVNDGTGRFTEQAAAFGLDVDGNHRGALWFDADGDTDLDLVTVGDCFTSVPCTGAPTVRLHQQLSGGTFREVTVGCGFDRDLASFSDSHVGGLAAGDVDGDGDLDLLVTIWEGLAYLFINDGIGRFEEQGAARGIQALANYWQPALFDLDRDGAMDIFQAVDFTANYLWVNQGAGTFVDQAPQAGVASSFNEMGVALADHDRDGDLDLYVTNIHVPGIRYNTLYRRDAGGLQFTEVSGAMGVQDSGCGWGTSFVDLDHDGWFDLPASNGCPGRSSRVFWNGLGVTGSYVDATDRAGFGGRDGTGLVTFDMDGDGDRDMAQVGLDGLRLYENLHLGGPLRRHIVIRPRMGAANHHAVGALVTITDGEYRTSRPILAGQSVLSQEPYEAHFGVGSATTVDVRVDFPDGRSVVMEEMPVGQTVTVTAP
ncbi:MAG: CRTAC1 family protein [Planctomycetota bacterium]|nr:CRTAC1 family protein [Planctomycetota bacterium]